VTIRYTSNPQAPIRGRSVHHRTDVVPRHRALLTCKYLGRPIASLGWIPLGYSTFTYSIAWLTGVAAINPTQTADAFSRFFGLGPLSRPFGIGLYFLVIATVGVIQNCATTLGEEIGWRGFLVPELAKHFQSRQPLFSPA
jgi:membrane protease YdiL (CAAX protease family)